MPDFGLDVIAGVLAHMNEDHRDDSLRIVRAHGRPEAIAAVMSGFDAGGGTWLVTEESGTTQLRIDWPNAPVADRDGIRRAVVELHRIACRRLGVPAAPA